LIPEALLTTQPSAGQVWRIIENQEQAATRRITRSAAAQSRLEELLDQNKPAYLPGSEHLHWLLKTPFRYPPLPHGSRFGSPFEPGILYGARELRTAMTESAVYLWLFRSAPLETGPLERISDGRTAIQFPVSHERFSDLTTTRAGGYRQRISDPGNYQFSQALGTQLREAGAAAIWFHSARTTEGVNCAVLNPEAIPTNTVPEENHWQLQLDDTHCWWGQAGGESFEVQYQDVIDSSGRIPHPAL
jgi:RES domain-containing protein